MDSIADMLTRIRNANMRFKESVDIPSSKVKQNIVKLLKEEGFIRSYRYIEDNKQGIIRVYLKYANNNKKRIINSIRKISLPSRRVYVKADKIPKVKGGIGTLIISTSRGIMTDKTAREMHLGGEVLCEIW